jgi:ArsR family metal-binding transcriptional regulator
MPEGLIRNFEARLAEIDCRPGTEWYRVVVRLDDDITGALPYLNAELRPSADYHSSNGVLIWKNGDRTYAFRPNEIAIAPVYDNGEAQELAARIIETVNGIWRRRDTITPKFEARKPPPNVLDIYRLLPGSNCGECGFPSCMAFAAELRTDPGKTSLCPFIAEQDLDKTAMDRGSGH